MRTTCYHFCHRHTMLITHFVPLHLKVVERVCCQTLCSCHALADFFPLAVTSSPNCFITGSSSAYELKIFSYISKINPWLTTPCFTFTVGVEIGASSSSSPPCRRQFDQRPYSFFPVPHPVSFLGDDSKICQHSQLLKLVRTSNRDVIDCNEVLDPKIEHEVLHNTAMLMRALGYHNHHCGSLLLFHCLPLPWSKSSHFKSWQAQEVCSRISPLIHRLRA